MKTFVTCTLAAALLSTSAPMAFAQERGEHEAESASVPVGFDLLPYLGTSSAAPDARRDLSFNLGGGLSGGINSLEIAAGFNLTSGDVRGAQFAGGFNIVAADVDAAQGAGGFNIVTGASNGAQAAGGFNVAGGGIDGAQAAGGFNIAGGAVNGAQVAGGLNIAGGAVNGAQVAGGFNIAAGPVAGAQIAPINIAGDHVDGVQVGVINIAKSAEAGVGLIGIYWDGFVEAEAFGSDDGLMMGGIRHGSGSFYNVYFAGTRPFADESLPFAYGLGFGWRAEIGSRAEFSLDLTATSVVGGADDWDWDEQYNLFKLRPMVSVDLVDGLALFGGPTATLLLDHSDRGVDADDLALVDSWTLTDADSEVGVALWPGFTVGARFF